MGAILPAPGSASVEQLLRDARAGSSDALGKLLDAFRRYLLAVCDGAVPNDLQPKGGASDLVQDTFLEAHQAFPRFTGNSREELCAWLRKILVRNLANFRHRYRAVAKRQAIREVRLDDSRTGGPLRRRLTAEHASPVAEAIRHEQSTQIQVAVMSLPGPYRDVVVLRSRDRLSFDAIGVRMGCSAEAARKLWMRATQQVAARLKHDGHPDRPA
ncbi:MAG TPA: sigma-70 family RNA polymerase sigma factor [Gemmataceae bacterium]|jgi:RNA polymerase sigma-70 factor (ECF subfamily)